MGFLILVCLHVICSRGNPDDKIPSFEKQGSFSPRCLIYLYDLKQETGIWVSVISTVIDTFFFPDHVKYILT